MEYDRYQYNSKLFIIGLVCLLLSLSFFIFGLYILPYLLWGWAYDVPSFILVFREWLISSYSMSSKFASWVIFFIFIVPAVICCYISYYASNFIDDHIYNLVPEKMPNQPEIKRDIKETLKFSLQILGLIILVLIALAFLQWVFIIV